MSANKQSMRSKIDSFFRNESSTKKTNKLSKDLEDPVDIYSHTKQFFNQDATEYDNKVEIGERRIKGDISTMNELDQLVYGGQKISR